MNPKSFKDVLAAAKHDGFKWVQFATGGKTYFISIEKLYLKLMTNDTFIPLLIQQQWKYSPTIGAIKFHESELGMSLHPFPTVPNEPEIDYDYDYAG